MLRHRGSNPTTVDKLERKENASPKASRIAKLRGRQLLVEVGWRACADTGDKGRDLDSGNLKDTGLDFPSWESGLESDPHRMRRIGFS